MLDNLVTKFHDLKAKRENGEGGFTLIELLVVVVIIGILIAIAIPLYLNYQKGAHDKQGQSDLRAAVSAIQQCYTDNGNKLPTTVTASASFGADLAMTCGTAQQKSPVSDNVKLAYAADGTTDYVLTATVQGGKGDTFYYPSKTGKITTTNPNAATTTP